jgi:hypothetical protein
MHKPFQAEHSLRKDIESFKRKIFGSMKLIEFDILAGLKIEGREGIFPISRGNKA